MRAGLSGHAAPIRRIPDRVRAVGNGNLLLLALLLPCCLWISERWEHRLQENTRGVARLPRAAPNKKGKIVMPRKSLWFSIALAMVVSVLLIASVDAKPKRKKQSSVSGPPTLSLAADPISVRACADESSRVALIATARSPVGGPLRYKWTTNGGRLTGQGPNPTWDLAGVQPGVYQAVVEVDDGRDLNCVAFSSVSIVVTDCPPPPPEIICPNVTISCPER